MTPTHAARENHLLEYDERVQRALTELQDLIHTRWPQATFRVAYGEDDPQMVHLWTTVDVEDTDEVVDVVIDRVVELQLEEGVPLSVIPVRPVERVLQAQRGEQRDHDASSLA
jgi:hypothetical protein